MYMNEKILTKMASYEGYESIDEMLEEATFDSLATAICLNCEYTTKMEPDQTEGYCEDCGSNKVVSCLVLAGLI